jgi:hypothetical protein
VIDKDPCDEYSCDKTSVAGKDEGKEAQVHPLPSQLAYELWQARRAETERGPHPAARRASPDRRPRRPRSVRESTGWFLVDLGIRLAAPHSPLSSVR